MRTLNENFTFNDLPAFDSKWVDNGWVYYEWNTSNDRVILVITSTGIGFIISKNTDSTIFRPLQRSLGIIKGILEQT